MPSYTHIDQLDSPALIIDRHRVDSNIRHAVERVGDVRRLRPHVKTHKSAEITAMMIAAGITKFKCATIAEAEMLGAAGAEDVLLAYQPAGPKVERFLALMKQFPSTRFSAVVDSAVAAGAIAIAAQKLDAVVDLFVDLDCGMHRTGIAPEKAMPLVQFINSTTGLAFRGLHAYDGHIADIDVAVRTKRVEEAFGPVDALRSDVERQLDRSIIVVAGGSPTYRIHAQRGDAECSPGTFALWDRNYQRIMPEEPFQPAAFVLTRVVSIPTDDRLTIDLGHKSVASENPHPRVYFPALPDATAVGHSEEHLVLSVPDARRFRVGDAFFGIPHHVCPTVALYERMAVAENGGIVGEWRVTARDKKLSL